ANRPVHEEPAEPIQRPEQDQEVARLQPRRPIPERDGGYEQREPAQPEREQELDHELAAIRIRRPQRRHDRLARQDHHVADLLQQVLGRQKRSIGYSANHVGSPPGYTSAQANEPARASEEYVIVALGYNLQPSGQPPLGVEVTV